MFSMLTILTMLAVFSPLVGSVLAGLLGHVLTRNQVYGCAIGCLLITLSAALGMAWYVVFQNVSLSINVYHYFSFSGFNIGFMIDRLSVVMVLLVAFVSLVVHVYSIGYMADENDAAAKRFFCYMSLFTFMMLMLVTANNFLQLFFGWEGVGLVSYLLIGFYYTRPSAVLGSFKAFIVNRVGDMGFILGIAALFAEVGSVDYQAVFSAAPNISSTHITAACILLFVGAMAKSAQMPLHIWLPESMEGPTPISALIHAATMVTAGVYMIARMAPVFHYSPVALSLVLVVGATTALFTGLLACVEYDIKRVIAFSTMSQLGYMMAANGVSDFSASIFHLLTHGCFKALLFLAVGSIIVALHHEQDLRKMGQLKKYLPVTWITFLIGALALSAIPPFAGYYSKEAIIEAVHGSLISGASYAYVCLVCGAFVTSYYIFRVYFLAFHGTERIDDALKPHVGERYISILIALIVLAIPSMGLGIFAPVRLAAFSVSHAWPLWFSVSGIVVAWFVAVAPGSQWVIRYFGWCGYVLKRQYGFDALYRACLVQPIQKMSQFLYHYGDLRLIDGMAVDGVGRQITRVAGWIQRLQSGYVYHYALFTLIGLIVFLCYFLGSKCLY